MFLIFFEKVGTGLGPTLEFYALVSKELQRSDLELWRGDTVQATSPADPNIKLNYAQSACGLFPAPLHRGSKAAHVNKVKAKFKFLGKFMGKALMDSRMVIFFFYFLLIKISLLVISSVLELNANEIKKQNTSLFEYFFANGRKVIFCVILHEFMDNLCNNYE